jgi:anti-sigma B factor antagonist
MSRASDRTRSWVPASVPPQRRGSAHRNPRPDAPATQVMSVETEQLADGASLVSVTGDVDMLTAPRLRTALTACLDHGCSALVIDLRDVAFLASSGLAVLVEVRRTAERQATPLRLIATTKVVTRPLAATGLIDVFEVCGTLQEAAKIA